MTVITARDNPRVRRWRALAEDARERRREGRALIEGEHLITACLDAGGRIEQLLLGKAAVGTFAALARRVSKAPVILGDAVFRAITGVDTPVGIAAEIALPPAEINLGGAPSCVLLERVQDAGNVGAILRSAAAFGIAHAVLGPGCADAWSPKVLRAGMGAHFSLHVAENVDLEDAIGRFAGRLCCTVPRGGVPLPQADLAGRIAWLFGTEGQGVSEALAARADLKISIPMPGTAESLNVAAAAAVCFYEFSRRAA